MVDHTGRYYGAGLRGLQGLNQGYPTKVERDYRGIGLAEVVWKLGTVILNFCLTTSIDFHDVLYGFWAGRGIGATSLEAKLIHQIMVMR